MTFIQKKINCEEKDYYLNSLREILKTDMDFKGEKNKNSSHVLHSFPAKFPPQLPEIFILNLTSENEVILDPMAGSGTTLVEGILNNRQVIGFDIDPLALMISRVKTTRYQKGLLLNIYDNILNKIPFLISNEEGILDSIYSRFDQETKKFINYWFYNDTIKELLALIGAISEIEDTNAKMFFKVVFSSIIITKTGGVSLALDLAHTRPHKAKKIYNSNSELILNFSKGKKIRHDFCEKKLRSPLAEFKKKFFQSIQNINTSNQGMKARVEYADSQNMPLDSETIDLIVTSPPYASNAIDYMRAHKFSLIWFDYKIEELKDTRGKYIGGEATSNYSFKEMPKFTSKIISRIAEKNKKRSLVLQRYYSEMTLVLKEMYRVLKPGKAAILVVGNSKISGVVTETHLCLKEIGETLGFYVPDIGVRKIDRNRRMMPASETNNDSKIHDRMHEEYVIGFYKEKGENGLTRFPK